MYIYDLKIAAFASSNSIAAGFDDNLSQLNH